MPDLIVIGAGHASIEAALAGARFGVDTLLITMDKNKIGQMSCNPAIGGVGKGQVVREIDALGGEMARATDRAGLQFKMLNRGKGPAVWSPRVQCDRSLYRDVMTQTVLGQPNLTVLEDEVVGLLMETGRVAGVRTSRAGEIRSRSVVVGAGTFMKGLLHRGFETTPGGRMGEPPSAHLSDYLRSVGFEVGRLKTGTPPRLDGRTIDYSKCLLAPGDDPPTPMSHFTASLPQRQLPCWLTRTTEIAHEAIRKNLDRSPLYTGRIQGLGPRYCPSIEDKVVKFSHHDHHQVFIEPEGYNTDEVYVNGLSTSLPEDVQESVVRAVPGLENARFIRYGYAVEYDFCPPTQLKPSLETKEVGGLFFAGQINGTTGYEEAAGQGLMAGINAVHYLRGQSPLTLGRDEAYIGVMIDDLVTKGTDEPYRLMTSRAEYRLRLRWDNADLRLMDHGRRVGLLSSQMYDHFLGYRGRLWEAARESLPADAESGFFEDLPAPELMNRPEPSGGHRNGPNPWGEAHVHRQVEIERVYWGYMKRERAEIAKFLRLETRKIPPDLDYSKVHGLLTEARQKLSRVRPESLGQAARVPGVTPADAGVLLVHLERRRRERVEG
ncbi:MAG: tRNA uridine-5-carboxymethylaminomethyl(34) synthesis enzyme MnmG [Elusimicrobia bacterium]|jgi:tRNA uridine 5-carboxymethylaminomethyl modification enzyme|nr:tRNA uridine-5-carboxymethylaminomethyl(34) synthesis enzyme MnmG [Elusimicrobiota bacterium]